MARRGHSTTIGKIAKLHHDRRVSEIRMLGEMLRREQRIGPETRHEQGAVTAGHGTSR